MEDTNFKVIVLVVLGLMLGMMASHVYAAESKWYGIGEVGASKLHRHKNNGHWYVRGFPHTEREETLMWSLGAGYKLRPWVALETTYTDLGNYRATSILSPACDAPETCNGQYPEIQRVTYATTGMCSHPDVNTGESCPPALKYDFDGRQYVLAFSAKFKPWYRHRISPFVRVGAFYGWEKLQINVYNQDGALAFRVKDWSEYERNTEGLILGVGFDRGRFSGELRHYDGVGGSSVNWNGATTMTFGVRF